VPVFEINGNSYEVDEDGFLQEPERWNHEVAKDFANTEAITDLTEEHWKSLTTSAITTWSLASRQWFARSVKKLATN